MCFQPVQKMNASDWRGTTVLTVCQPILCLSSRNCLGPSEPNLSDSEIHLIVAVDQPELICFLGFISGKLAFSFE